jgi:hypothetical protein
LVFQANQIWKKKVSKPLLALLAFSKWEIRAFFKNSFPFSPIMLWSPVFHFYDSGDVIYDFGYS